MRKFPSLGILAIASASVVCLAEDPAKAPQQTAAPTTAIPQTISQVIVSGRIMSLSDYRQHATGQPKAATQADRETSRESATTESEGRVTRGDPTTTGADGQAGDAPRWEGLPEETMVLVAKEGFRNRASGEGIYLLVLNPDDSVGKAVLAKTERTYSDPLEQLNQDRLLVRGTDDEDKPAAKSHDREPLSRDDVKSKFGGKEVQVTGKMLSNGNIRAIVVTAIEGSEARSESRQQAQPQAQPQEGTQQDPSTTQPQSEPAPKE